MKLKKKIGEHQRTVDFHGINVTISKQERWVAVDANGSLWVYSKCPSAGEDKWHLSQGALNATNLKFEIDMDGVDWTETLVHYPDTTPRVISTKFDPFKVDFHGVELTVPRDGYIAMQPSGVVVWFYSRPMMTSFADGWTTNSNGYLAIAEVRIPTLDWKKSITACSKGV